jgi:hypothetical protein
LAGLKMVKVRGDGDEEQRRDALRAVRIGAVIDGRSF